MSWTLAVAANKQFTSRQTGSACVIQAGQFAAQSRELSRESEPRWTDKRPLDTVVADYAADPLGDWDRTLRLPWSITFGVCDPVGGVGEVSGPPIVEQSHGDV